MAIKLHHLHPGHDDELTHLKARIAELEDMSEQYKNKQTPYQIRRKQPLPAAPKEQA